VTQRRGIGFAALDRHFAIDMPFWRFALNTLIASCLSLAPLMLLYVALTPGFGSMLLDGGPQLRLFLRQVAANGLPIVFVVNFVGFFLYAALVGRTRSAQAAALALVIDPVARIVVFVALHAAIYVAAARWFGSFGGDGWRALQVVGPTLARSAAFGNVSGVYLYATLVSALPLYAAAVERLLGGSTRPGAQAVAIAAALLLFAAIALVLTGLTALLGRL
jgi:hypothetical protein